MSLMACDELNLPADAVTDASLTAWLKKRNPGSLLESWNFRFMVLKNNYLLTYVNAKARV